MKIFIWGMGLLGASLALRLQKSGHTIRGAVRSHRSQKILNDFGFHDVVTEYDDALPYLKTCDILILGINIADCFPLLQSLLREPTFPSNILIMDICSTKAEICNFMQNNFPQALFIGCHPMAGRETTGPASADETLFEGTTTFICPPSNPHAEMHLPTVTALFENVGSHPVVINPERHDVLMAHISHGLHLQACVIANLTENCDLSNLPASIAGGSFRDMTRVTESSGVMWQEIIDSNKENVIDWLEKMRSELGRQIELLKRNKLNVSELFERAKKNRHKII